MIIDLPECTTSDVTKRLRELREERGEVATGRVLTLIVVVHAGDDLADVISTVQDASREHPARVVVLVCDSECDSSSLDAQIRLGGDAGASEVIVLTLHGELAAHRASVVTPLLLPDTPVVAWWPSQPPRNLAADPIGALATRRICDSLHDHDPDGIYRRRVTYTPGDSDLVWSRLTLWRGQLAATLDQPPLQPVQSVELYGPSGDPAVDIAAGWLAECLDVPVTRYHSAPGDMAVDTAGEPVMPVLKTVLHRAEPTQEGSENSEPAGADAPQATPGDSAGGPDSSGVGSGGDIVVEVVDSRTVRCGVGRSSALVVLSRRPEGDCLAEELRHLDPDHAFGRALRGLIRVERPDHAPRRRRVDPAMDADAEASRR